MRNRSAFRWFRSFKGYPRMYCSLSALLPRSSHYLTDFLYMLECLSKSRDGGAGAMACPCLTPIVNRCQQRSSILGLSRFWTNGKHKRLTGTTPIEEGVGRQSLAEQDWPRSGTYAMRSGVPEWLERNLFFVPIKLNCEKSWLVGSSRSKIDATKDWPSRKPA